MSPPFIPPSTGKSQYYPYDTKGHRDNPVSGLKVASRILRDEFWPWEYLSKVSVLQPPLSFHQDVANGIQTYC